MKCRRATDLTDRYLDGRLESKTRDLLKAHYASCSRCSSRLIADNSLIEAFGQDRYTSEIPLDFTQRVMEKVFELEADRLKDRRVHDLQDHAAIFKRLGFSMLLSAAVMLFCMHIPSINDRNVSRFVNAEAGAFVQRTMQLTDSIYEMNHRIKDIFRNFNNTVEKFKEV